MIQPTNAQQPYMMPGGANAVSINIFNPQAYGSTPQAQAGQIPYNYTNSLYNVPQASLYQPQAPMPAQYPMMPQAFLPEQLHQGFAYLPQIAPQEVQQQYVPQAYIPQALPQPQPAPMPQTLPQQQAAPAPQVMPESVLQEAPQAPQAQEVPQAPQEAPQAAQEAPQTVESPKAPAVQIDTDALIAGLKNNDPKTREASINEIARDVQQFPADAKQKLVSEPVMQALVDVINEDTTSLQGPTDAQIAVAEKIVKGEALTPEEEALSDNLAPRDAANLNRAYSLYTLAMLQKMQRDEVDEYIESQKENGQDTIAPLKISDLYGYNDVVNVIQNDVRPEVQIAAIQALRYVARPEDKETIKDVLASSLNSQDEDVKNAAQEVLDEMPKDGTILEMPQQQAQAA